MKLWAGRFTKETDDRVNTFNSSLSFDCRMYKHDIKGSMAHAKMLGKCGIIPMEDVDAILKGLEGILKDIEHKITHKVYFDDIQKNLKNWLDSAKTAIPKPHVLNKTPSVTYPYGV